MTEAEWLAWLTACKAMKEQGWLTHSDPYPMLTFLRDKGSDRKLRLFACACCRRVWDLLENSLSRHAVDVAERFAEGLVGTQETDSIERATHETALHIDRGPKRYAGCAANRTVWGDAGDAALRASENASYAASIAHGGPWADVTARNSEVNAQANLLRDIFGNPFHSVPVDPNWRTTNVISLAQPIYADRAFDRLPILADALEDAGCTNTEILDHCRGGGEHVRGCWVVDLMLGKF